MIKTGGWSANILKKDLETQLDSPSSPLLHSFISFRRQCSQKHETNTATQKHSYTILKTVEKYKSIQKALLPLGNYLEHGINIREVHRAKGHIHHHQLSPQISFSFQLSRRGPTHPSTNSSHPIHPRWCRCQSTYTSNVSEGQMAWLTDQKYVPVYRTKFGR